MKKRTIYFMPGMAASPQIFENLRINTSDRIVFLEWSLPALNQSLGEYARAMALKLDADRFILVGVSFGGILVQEMCNYCQPEKIILISSVKSPREFPLRLKIARKTYIHRLIPMWWVGKMEILIKLTQGQRLNKRLRLYQMYLSVNDPNYLRWAIRSIVEWKGVTLKVPVIHLQGEYDAVFPTKNLTNYVSVPKGTHTMILHRAKWFNEHLPKYLGV